MGTDDDLEIPTFLRRQPTDAAKEKDKVMPDTATEAKTPDKAPAKAKAPAKPKAPAKAKAPAPEKAAPVAPVKAPSKVKLDAYGYRDGTLKSKAAAMYSKGKGATIEEVKAALGSVQLNVVSELEKQGYPITRTKEDGKGARQVTRYKIGTKA